MDPPIEPMARRRAALSRRRPLSDNRVSYAIIEMSMRGLKSSTYECPGIAHRYSAMRNLTQDVRFGLRVLFGSPAFPATAVLTLGLGIASTTTVFSWIDTVLLHPYPGTSRSDELAAVEMISKGAPNGGTSISWPDYRDFRDRLQ